MFQCFSLALKAHVSMLQPGIESTCFNASAVLKVCKTLPTASSMVMTMVVHSTFVTLQKQIHAPAVIFATNPRKHVACHVMHISNNKVHLAHKLL
jgi:hypothetical protein